MVTVPWLPSTRMRWPVLMVLVPKAVPVTAGRPYSRQTMAAWAIIPPTSVTVAPILPKIGAQLGAVRGATRIWPAWTSPIWSAEKITRAGPSATPGEAAKPLRLPSPPPSPAPSHCLTLSPVMPQSMMVNGSVTTSGGRRRPGPQRGQDAPAALQLPAPVDRAAGLGPDRPGAVVVPQGLGDLVPLEQEDVGLAAEEPLLGQDPAELAHLAPQHRVAPVLDVEVVVLDVGEHHPGQAELLLEGGPVLVGGQQLAVLAHDPVALGPDGLDGPADVDPLAQLGDVVAHEPERDLQVLQPHLVGVVEAAARGEVEPRLGRRLPLGQPGLPGVAAPQGLDHLGRRGLPEGAVDAAVDGQAGQLLELLVRLEQVDLDPGDHLGDGQVGDAGEGLLAEPEEVQVGGVAEVEELEVVLPQLQGQVDQLVVLALELEAGAHAPALGDH